MKTVDSVHPGDSVYEGVNKTGPCEQKHAAQKSTLSHTRAEDYSRRKFEIARIVYATLRSKAAKAGVDR